MLQVLDGSVTRPLPRRGFVAGRLRPQTRPNLAYQFQKCSVARLKSLVAGLFWTKVELRANVPPILSNFWRHRVSCHVLSVHWTWLLNTMFSSIFQLISLIIFQTLSKGGATGWMCACVLACVQSLSLRSCSLLTQKPCTKHRLHCTYERGFLPVHSYMYTLSRRYKIAFI